MRPQVVIPESLLDELVGIFILEKLQVRERCLPAKLTVVVDDLVLEDPNQPADERPAKLSFERTATSNVSWTRSSATSGVRTRTNAYR